MRISSLIGWSLVSFFLILFGALSTMLNILQLMNGFMCFDRVSNTNAISGAFYRVSSSVDSESGHGRSPVYEEFCTNITEDGYHMKFFTVRSGGYFSAKVSFDCSSPPVETSNILYINPSNAFILPSKGDQTKGRLASVYYDSGLCMLQRRTYNGFAIFCAFFILIMTVIRILLRTVLLTATTKLFFSRHFNWLFRLLDKLEMFDFCNPNINCPQPINESDELYEFSDCYPGGNLDTSSYSHQSYGLLYQFSYRCGVADIKVCNRSCTFHENSPMSIEEASELRKCVVIKAENKYIISSSHNMSMDECYSEVKRGRRLILSKDRPSFLFGKTFKEICSNKPLFISIKEHMSKFFGFYSNALLKEALVSHVLPLGLNAKNSEWKIYISDLYFHLGVKKQSRCKMHKPSRSFASYKGTKVVESLEVELSILSGKEEKKIRDYSDIQDKSLSSSYKKSCDTLFPVSDSEEENRAKLIEFSRENPRAAATLYDCLVDPTQISRSFPLILDDPRSNDISAVNKKVGKYALYNGNINTLGWLKANHPEQVRWDGLLRWGYRMPKCLKVDNYESRLKEVECYLSELRDACKETTRLLKSTKKEDLEKHDRLISETEAKIEKDNHYLSKEHKASRILRYEKIISEGEDKLRELRANRPPEPFIKEDYERHFSNVRRIANSPIHLKCVDSFTGDSKECPVMIVEKPQRESSESGRDVPVKPDLKLYNKIVQKIRKRTKGVFEVLSKPIGESLLCAVKGGKAPSINRFRFSYEGKDYLFWKPLKHDIKRDFKKFVNAKKGSSPDKEKLTSVLGHPDIELGHLNFSMNANKVECLSLILEMYEKNINSYMFFKEKALKNVQMSEAVELHSRYLSL